MEATLRRVSVAAVLVVLLGVGVAAHAQTTIDADEQRGLATDILSERTYDPLRTDTGGDSFLERIGDRLTRWLEGLPQGTGRLVMILVAMIAVSVAGVAAARVIRGRVDKAQKAAVAGRNGSVETPDPGKLEFAAARAAEQGDYATAVRLRFEAGLTRLDMAGATPVHETLTSGQVGDLLELEEYDRLAGTFDAVAYGGRPAAGADDEQARLGWPVVLDRARDK